MYIAIAILMYNVLILAYNRMLSVSVKSAMRHSNSKYHLWLELNSWTYRESIATRHCPRSSSRSRRISFTLLLSFYPSWVAKYVLVKNPLLLTMCSCMTTRDILRYLLVFLRVFRLARIVKRRHKKLWDSHQVRGYHKHLGQLFLPRTIT